MQKHESVTHTQGVELATESACERDQMQNLKSEIFTTAIEIRSKAKENHAERSKKAMMTMSHRRKKNQ